MTEGLDHWSSLSRTKIVSLPSSYAVSSLLTIIRPLSPRCRCRASAIPASMSAHLIAFLLSDDAAYLTAQTIHVDGGTGTLR